MPQCRPAISEGQGRLQRPGFHSGSTNPEAPRPVKWVRRGSHGWAPRSLRSRSCHERPAAEAEEGKEEGRSGKSDGKAENDLNQEIGRATGRERVCQYVKISVVAVSLKKKQEKEKLKIRYKDKIKKK